MTAHAADVPANQPVASGEGRQLLPWILAAFGALAGLLGWLLLDGDGWDVPWRIGLAAAVVFGALALSFTLEPERALPSAIFAGIVAMVLGGLAFHIARSGESLAGPEYAFAAGLLAAGLALPLFQAGFHRHRFATSYERVHFHVWTDAVAGACAGAFALLSLLLLMLLNGLLDLVGIDLIERMLEEGWLAPVWMGAAFGAALGVLRDNLKVIGALQSVALLVLALLAVPLACALLVFLAALLASGGAALWEATDSATPVLLACAAGCFVLANAVIRDDAASASRNRVMRAAALVLVLGILPLAGFAAISMGLRIDQHGLAPERLWALVAIGVAVAFGLAYWVACARGRGPGWTLQLRAANLRLVAGVCVLALLLSLPLVDFGAISARNQVARLEARDVAADEFDYAALRWDFGDGGREALARLARGGGKVARLAKAALIEKERSYPPADPAQGARAAAAVRFESADPRIERAVRAYLSRVPWMCPEDACTAIVTGAQGGGTYVALVSRIGTVFHLMIDRDGGATEAMVREGTLTITSAPRPAPQPVSGAKVELRPYTGQQVHIGGQPVGEPFAEPPLEAPLAHR